MARGSSSPALDVSPIVPIATAVLAIAIFVADTVTTKDFAIPTLYIAVVLMAARFCAARNLVLGAAGTVALTVLSYLLAPPIAPADEALFNTLLRCTTIGVATFLVLQSQSAEAALREQAGLLDLTHDTIFVRDMNDVITYWNRGAEERYGWPREQAVGKVSHQLMQTIFPAPLEAITAELHRTGRWEGELVHAKRDGTQVIVASRWSLQRDEHGNPLATLETNNDITEQKQAEEALLESEQKWKAVFENNPTMYFMLDGAGTILSVNPFGAEQLGYSVDELVGRSVLDIFYEADRGTIQRNVAICLEQLGQSMRWEARKVRKDSAVLWVCETARAISMKQRPVVLIACEDITERRRAEEELRRSEGRYRYIFQAAGVSIWEEDFSRVEVAIDELKAGGVRDFRRYWPTTPNLFGRRSPG